MFSCGFRIPRLVVAAAGCSALLAVGLPLATAAPATDEQGFVDSAARCTTPEVAVAFGSTDSSRVAICKTPGGQYEYHGVRMSDGAKLIVPASQSSDGGFLADNDGIVYTVTAKSLVISTGQQMLREEPMTYFQGPETLTAPTGTTTSTPTPTTPTTPLPPPLPAEVGGSDH